MGPPGLEDPVELLRPGLQGGPQPYQVRQEGLPDGREGGEVRDRGDHVVGGLAPVDVVVGVDRVLGPPGAAEQLAGPVGDDLVGVHVRRGAGSRLEHVDHELVVVSAGDHLLGGDPDGAGELGGEQVELLVGLGGRPLDQAEGPDEPVAEAPGGDGEVLDGALGLGAVVGGGGDLHLPHRVLLHPGLPHYG